MKNYIIQAFVRVYDEKGILEDLVKKNFNVRALVIDRIIEDKKIVQHCAWDEGGFPI